MANQPQESVSILTGELVVGNQASLSVYASEPQSKLQFASRTIAEIAMRNTADIELTINQVLREIEIIDGTLSQSPRRSIFSFGAVEKTRLVKKYEALLEQINEMTLALQLQQAALIKENFQLKKLEPILEECCSVFARHIEFASAVSDKLRHGNMIIEDSSLTDSEIREWEARLERKLEDIRISHTVSMQSIAQVRVLRENNQQIIDRITAAVTNTIPIWRTQVVLSLNIERFRTEISLQETVANTLNSTMKNTSKELRKRPKHTTIDFEKLKSINRELVHTLSELEKVEKE